VQHIEAFGKVTNIKMVKKEEDREDEGNYNTMVYVR
jgi:hypothetical protein